MPRALRVCPVPGCPEIGDGRCAAHRREAEQRRGSARQRGYDREHQTRFRPGVLRKHPRCVCGNTTHGHGRPCLAPSVHADHHPLNRRQLAAQGLDPNDPAHGRGLCPSCHSAETAATPGQEGGWNRR